MTDDASLLRLLDASWNEARRLAGDHLACRAGCTECCIGAFPITRLDGGRLRAGLAILTAADPAAARDVVERALSQVREMGGGLPEDDAEAEAFLGRHASLPCPALDPRDGRCLVYDHRPVSCRTFGPPVTIGEERLPPCRLCFTRADGETIEACRVTIDPEDLEGALVEDAPETLVAFALAEGQKPMPIDTCGPRSSTYPPTRSSQR